MTAKSKNDLISQVNTLKPDNNDKDISPADSRQTDIDGIDSALNIAETSAQAVVGEVDFTGGLKKGGADVSTFIDTRGWEYYQHGTTGQTISTTAALIQINGSGSLTDKTSKSPSDASSDLWDTTNYKIDPIQLYDGYQVRLDIPVTAKTGSPNALMLEADIGGTSTPTVVILDPYQSISLTAPYTVVFAIPLVVLASAVVNNGIQLFLKTDAGSVTLGSPAILIKRDI